MGGGGGVAWGISCMSVRGSCMRRESCMSGRRVV